MEGLDQAQEVVIDEPIPPPFDDDLRIDSEDDDNLEKLPEIERELILSERHDVLQRYKEARVLYEKYIRRMNPGKQQEPAGKSAPKPKSTGQKRASRYSEESDDASSSSYSSSRSDSSNSSDSESDDEEATLRGVAKVATEEAIAESFDSGLTLDQCTKLQATRDVLLSSFQDVPSELRDECLEDLLVRVPSGAGEYLIGTIVRALDRTSKTAESGKFDLEISLSSGTAVTVPVSSVSNSPISDTELDAWKKQVGESVAIETARKIHRKQSQLRHVKEFVWDDRTINRILSQKNRSSVKLTLEIAKLRTQLQAELGAVKSTSVSEEQRSVIQENINRINAEISALESQYRSTQQSFSDAHAHQFGIVAINHRNRTEQRKQDVEEARKRLKSSKTEAQDAQQLNPFKRRECKPVVMWDVGKRSPKKDPHPDPNLSLHAKDAAALDTRMGSQQPKLLTEIVPLEDLVSKVSEATSRSDARLAAVRRNMALYYSDAQAEVWEGQLVGIQPGEIMEFAEWKRRVAEDVDMQD